MADRRARRVSLLGLGVSGLAVSLVLSGSANPAAAAPGTVSGAASTAATASTASTASSSTAGSVAAAAGENDQGAGNDGNDQDDQGEDEQGSASEQAQALAQAAATGEPVEVDAAATPTETLTANPDQTLTLGISQTPVRVENAAGDLVDIDPTLKAATGGDLATRATIADVRLDGDGNTPAASRLDGALVQASDADSKVSVGLGYDGALGAPVVDGAAATYPGEQGSAVRVAATEAGFTAHVILDEAPTDLSGGAGGGDGGLVYRFPLQVQGATARLAGGGLQFTDAQGVVVGESSPLRMWDASLDEMGDPGNVVPVEAALVRGAGGGQVLELRPDPAYLSDPDTQYPVTIDPDVTLSPEGQTYITDADANGGFASDWNLRVGSPNGTDQYESFVNFDVDNRVGDAVTQATLRLYQYGAGVCGTRRMNVVPTTADWAANPGGYGRTWNTRANVVGETSRFATNASFNYSAFGGGTPDCGTQGWQDIDVTPQASSWTTKIRKRFGMRLTTPENRRFNTEFEKRFCSFTNTASSGHCRGSNVKPQLAITYTPEIGDQSWYSTSEHPLGERDTLKINHYSGNAYLSSDDVKVSSLGGDMVLGRRYNSRAENIGSFGSKWTLSAGPDVWLEKLDEWRYVYHAPDGAELGPFTRTADTASENGYREFSHPASGVGADLKDENDGTFTLTFHSSQKQYVFAPQGAGGDLYQTKEKDRSGNTTTYNYVAGTSRLAAVVDTAGRIYQVTYGSGATAGFITQIRDTNGPSTRTWSYAYSDGRLVGYTDPEGDVTTYTWETAELTPDPVLATITDPVNASGQAPTTTLSTRAGETTKTVYAGGTSAGPDAARDSEYVFEYHDTTAECPNTGAQRSARVRNLDPLAYTRYCFTDRAGDEDRTTTVFDGKNQKRSTSYTADQQPAIGTDATGATTVNSYGDPGTETSDRLEKTSQAKDSGSSGDGASTTYQYNATSSTKGSTYLPTNMVDGNGDCTAYGYDGMGRLNRTWLDRVPSGGRCDNVSGGLLYRSTYNGDGTVASMSDPNTNGAGSSPTEAQQTIFSYWQPGETGYVAGTKGQVKTMRRPGGSCATGARNLCTSYTYDGLARTATQTDGRGTQSSYDYDVMDRTTRSATAGTTAIAYTYDTAGNLTRRTDTQGTTTLGYDRLNRQTSQNTPDGVGVTYAYNRNGQLAQLRQNVPGVPVDVVDYTYDAAGEVNSVSDATGIIGMDYDSNQRLKLTTFPTGPAASSIDRTYTRAGQPKWINVRSGTSTNDGMTDYRYIWTDSDTKDTARLNKVKVENSGPAINYDAEFGYNDRGQLTGETRTNGGGGNYSYTYDNAGNLKTATRPNSGSGTTKTHYGYDQANQLCWTQTVAPTNDADYLKLNCAASAPNPASGQVVARDAAGNSEGDPTNPIDYNPRNQATNVAGTDQGYLDQGNDIRLTAGTTGFVNTQPGITARTKNAGTAGAETTFYTRTPDGRLLSSHKPGTGTSGTFFYVTDRQKSTVGLIDATGARAGTYRYDPYGKATLLEGTAAEADNPFRYIGGYQDNTIQPGGYIKLGARFYNPATAAFTQPDPELGNMGEPLRLNAYLYAGGDPCNNTDASGRCYGDIAVGAIAGAGVGALAGAVPAPITGGTSVGIGALGGGLLGGFGAGLACVAGSIF